MSQLEAVFLDGIHFYGYVQQNWCVSQGIVGSMINLHQVLIILMSST